MEDTTIKLQELEQEETKLKEKQEELQAITKKTEETEKALSASSKELERVQVLIGEAKEQKREAMAKDKTFQEQFKNEQFEKAKSRFFLEYDYTDEKSKTKVLEVFNKLNSQSVDSDNIFNDLIGAHLLLNRDKYTKLEGVVKKMSGSADKFIEAQSSSGFEAAGGIPNIGIELTEDEIRTAQWAGLAPEYYKELKQKGKV
jgi:myosin heavy subunit